MQGFDTLTSAANPLIKDVRRAAGHGALTSDGLCVAEGLHLLEEALRSRCETPVILVSEEARRKNKPISARIDRSSRLLVVDDKLFRTLATTETSQGVIALVRLPDWQTRDLFTPQSLVVVLDAIQDPGNAGAIFRAAEAFGATGVILTRGSVKPHNPKALRASMGSIFRVPHISGPDAAQTAELLSGQQLQIFTAMPWSGSEQLASAADLTRPSAIVIGNEGAGASPEFRRIATDLAIATTGVESLNAAVAASILLYEMRRQRT